MRKGTLRGLIMEYFENHPNQEIEDHVVMKWVVEQFRAKRGRGPTYPWRYIKQLSKEGHLIEVRKRVYKYVPDIPREAEQSESPTVKENSFQAEFGKRYVIRLYETAVANQDEKMIAFCRAVFDAYDEYEVDFHIARPDAEE